MAQSSSGLKLQDDPLWYKDAIIYEVHVRAFADSNGDGMGDFQGLASKLDYLQELGINTIWLLPFCPSPWKDDGYDISDFTDVHPAYGNLRDFQHFLREAHARGLRVITELVLNHSSDQHAWFQRARQAPAGSRLRDFYVWSDTPDRYKDARIIFKDFERSNWSWDPVAKAYYWHRFFAHQPDLNFDSPRVRSSMLEVLDFWFRMGVDGLRLDAVPYLYERESTNCENLAETHAFLRDLRKHVESKFRNRMLLAEANQWPEDAVAYFGQGDECHMAFHFPVMPRLFLANRMEDRFPVLDILQQTPTIPENSQWALFLRNHDELTLEMVTDEERDYMYRVYATDPQMRVNLGIRRRLAPLMGNDRRRIELMNALLFSLPGSPVVYYGDEVGMGDNIYLGDRNGVRTPMQWSADRNAGFSRANPQQLYMPVIIDPEYHYEAVNVETQLRNPSSLLWWMRRLIALRKEVKAFGRGSIEFLQPENRRVLAFLRRYQDRSVLVVANLSRFAQAAELDLSEFRGQAPFELFGRSEFPVIGEQPYLVTLGPYAFFWFSLEPARVRVETPVPHPAEGAVATLEVADWAEVLSPEGRDRISQRLPAFLKSRGWFPGKQRQIRQVRVAEVVAVPSTPGYFVLISVEYSDGDPESYLMAAALASGEAAAAIPADAVFLQLRNPSGETALLYGALWDKGFAQLLLDSIARRRRFKGEEGEVLGVPTSAFRRTISAGQQPLEPCLQRAGQTNNSVLFGDHFLLKIFRRLEPGVHPELEIGYFLSERTHFPNVAPIAGALEYRPKSGQPSTFGILQAFVPNQGNAWRFSLDSLGRFFENAMAKGGSGVVIPDFRTRPLAWLSEPVPDAASELIGGPYLEAMRLLGRRTAELHFALSSDGNDAAFAPEPFTDFYRHSLYHSMLGIMSRALALLRQRLRDLPEPVQAEGRQVLQLESEIRRRFQPIRDRRLDATRIRIHGNLHLGDVLHTGKDFVFVDFEGDAMRPLSERRIKRSPLRDVAALLRSIQYVSNAALYGQVSGVPVRAEDQPQLESWVRFWNIWVGLSFLREYLAAADNAHFLPRAKEDLEALLYAYMVEKALYEVNFELSHRPGWVRIPLRAILQLVS